MAVTSYEIITEQTPKEQKLQISYSKIFIRGLVLYYTVFVILIFVLFCTPIFMGKSKACDKFHGGTAESYVFLTFLADLLTFCWYPFLILLVVDIKTRENSSEHVFDWDPDPEPWCVCRYKYGCITFIFVYTVFLLLKQTVGGLVIFSSPVICPEQPVSQVVLAIFIWSVQSYWVFYNLCVLAVGLSEIRRTDGQHWVGCLKSFPNSVKKCFMEQVSEPVPV